MNKYNRQESFDNLPIPPLEYLILISGNPKLNVDDYFNIGKSCADTIKFIINKNHLDFQNFKEILDFGCGVGRVIRHFRDIKGVKLYGTDINPDFIGWCNRNLTFAEFSLNRAEPPLNYSEKMFDLIYAFSVFTHLPEDYQSLWFHELSRVLRPEGYLIFTTHGEAYSEYILDSYHKKKFQNGQLVAFNEHEVGKPLTYGQCSVFHPLEYVKEKIANGKPFELIDFIKGKVIDAGRGIIGQDVYLLKKNLL